MLVVMNSHATEKDIQRVAMFIESKGFEARVSHGEARTVQLHWQGEFMRFTGQEVHRVE